MSGFVSDRSDNRTDDSDDVNHDVNDSDDDYDPSFLCLLLAPVSLYVGMQASYLVFQLDATDQTGYYIGVIILACTLELYRDSWLWWHLAMVYQRLSVGGGNSRKLSNMGI